MKNILAVVSVLVSILHGTRSAEINHVVEDLSADKELSFGHQKRLDAVSTDDLSALVSSNVTENKGTCTMEKRLEAGFARKGAAFRQTMTPNAADCAYMCRTSVMGCVAVNYRASDKTCLFLADPGYIYFSPGYTTALVNPSLNNVCSADNLVLGYDRLGANMPGSSLSVATATECCWKCVTTPGCIAYVKSVKGTGCWLKQYPLDLRQSSYFSAGLVCLD